MGRSTKLDAVMQKIMEWSTEAPDDKIIGKYLTDKAVEARRADWWTVVFTQWVTCGKILGRMLQEVGIGFLYLFGNMAMEDRHKAVAGFSDNINAQVLVSTLSEAWRRYDY